jgi:hypothetical protein
MASDLPHLRVPRAPADWEQQADLLARRWDTVPALSPFILADGSRPATQQTVARICYDRQALHVRFDCDDRDIWGTYTRRDDPIYDEEVVEVFISPGAAVPTHYYEFEVSPNGVLFDAQVFNPTSERSRLELDIGWDCPEIAWAAGRDDAAQRWWAMLRIPWAAIAPPGALSLVWRANFYRIERPRDGWPEFSCWSPTLTDPADFHKPARFGVLELEML